MRPERYFLYIVIMLLLAMGCCFTNSHAGASRISVRDGRLTDADGRQAFLWGVNMGEKSSGRQHKSWHGPQDFHNLRRWGMNAVRFLIFWSAVEPEPGQYDETYLKSVDERVGWARDAGLHVILDMHQDLWSETIPGGNGAPAWATLDDGLSHRFLGGPWSTAYFTSPRIHRAFDNFWNNAPGPDGVGIQDRFALAWQQVAARYADNPTVAGFDIMNEPFPGSPIRDGALAVWRAVPDIFRGADMPDGFMALLASLEEKPFPGWLLNALDEPARHRRLLQALEPTMQQFEQDKLTAMYRRVHQAVREVNETGIFFLEPLVLANTGVPTFIEPLTDNDGNRDPLQAYMPHAYDIVLDTNLAHLPSQNRLDIIFSQKEQDAKRLGMPLLIGEWGAFYGNPQTRNAARMSASLIETMTSGAFYWSYDHHIEDAVYFECLARPQPLALAGTLIEQSFDPDSSRFQCTWNANPTLKVPSVFAAPKFWSSTPPIIEITPSTVSANMETHPEDMDTVYVVVESPDEAINITLTLQRQ
jgi:endoglycosylceramidase